MFLMESATDRRFYIIANNLALDFVNTLIVNEKGEPLELLGSFDDLIDWLSATGTIDAERTSLANRKLKGVTKTQIFERALRFRGELKKMARAVSEGNRVPASAVDAINEILAESRGHFELFKTSAGYATAFRTDHEDFADVLIPIAQSAARLLSEGDLSLVHKCQNSACVLYFYDNSKRHGRRWCSMSACGNRAKAAAHYQRTREI